MSSIVNYLSSWIYEPEEKGEISDNKETKETTVSYLISADDLMSVKLKPLKNIIPAPARNMPHITKFELNKLNQAHLKAILNVKLKPVELAIKPDKYLPRHPVLLELLSTRKLVC